MQCPASAIDSTAPLTNGLLEAPNTLEVELEVPNPALDSASDSLQPVHFRTHFTGYMDMLANVETVAAYLDAHEGWFCRCAQPMTAVPLGERGYVLTVGRFGSFGYEVEPKFAVVLEPPQDGLYFMHSVPLANEPNLGYEIDYRATMILSETEADRDLDKVFRKYAADRPDRVVRVEWTLEMDVAVQFPKCIYRLPMSVIQKTGDRLLSQIVRQISPRLTYKVQQDFHSRFDLPLPPKSSRHCQRVLVGAIDSTDDTNGEE